VELREDIQGLQAGDCVKLTFLSGARSFGGETLPVRITSITGADFRGKLVHSPTCKELSFLRTGVLIPFKTDHIHSIARPRPTLKSKDG